MSRGLSDTRPHLSCSSRLSYNGRTPTFRTISVYQTSRYPSSEKRSEKAFSLHSGGLKTSNADGKEILHPCFGLIGARNSRATIKALFGSSACVGLAVTSGFPSSTNERTGSNRGSFSTCSSDSRRYLPSDRRSNHACISSEPDNQGKRSENCLGKVIRPYWSAVTCSRLGPGAAFSIDSPAFSRNYGLNLSIIFSDFLKFILTSARIFPQHTKCSMDLTKRSISCANVLTEAKKKRI
jgi:hypothetical protein